MKHYVELTNGITAVINVHNFSALNVPCAIRKQIQDNLQENFNQDDWEFLPEQIPCEPIYTIELLSKRYRKKAILLTTKDTSMLFAAIQSYCTVEYVRRDTVVQAVKDSWNIETLWRHH